ncbi:hypothetical protein LCGC14_0453940 [marine sediment metagenome]|uniref:Uncharacterized protein n=1 Tax=marine sediment metagenome TaxID=412755 RepID=A0A0F9SM16_9ZZZZ|nr:hypothetical protein [bacterium]
MVKVAKPKRISTRRKVLQQLPKFTSEKAVRDPKFHLDPINRLAYIDWETKDKESIVTIQQKDDPIISGTAEYVQGDQEGGAIMINTYEFDGDRNIILVASNPSTREVKKKTLSPKTVKELRKEYFNNTGTFPSVTLDKIQLIEAILDEIYDKPGVFVDTSKMVIPDVDLSEIVTDKDLLD